MGTKASKRVHKLLMTVILETTAQRSSLFLGPFYTYGLGPLNRGIAVWYPGTGTYGLLHCLSIANRGSAIVVTGFYQLAKSIRIFNVTSESEEAKASNP
jgi:hypothetical protein